MREVLVSEAVIGKVADLRIYLVEQLKLSWEAAHKRTDRIDSFIIALGNEADYPIMPLQEMAGIGLSVRRV